MKQRDIFFNEVIDAQGGVSNMRTSSGVPIDTRVKVGV